MQKFFRWGPQAVTVRLGRANGQCWVFPCEMEQVQAWVVWYWAALDWLVPGQEDQRVKPMLEELWPEHLVHIIRPQESNVWKDFTVTNSCIQSGWDGINFPHSSPYSAVLCSGSWKDVDKTPIFWLPSSSAGTPSALTFQHYTYAHQQAGGGQGLRRGQGQDSWLK